MIDESDAYRHQSVSSRLRQKGDALSRRGDLIAARRAYEDALNAANAALEALSTQSPETLSEQTIVEVPHDRAARVADLLGVRGGLLRRLGRVSEALRSYQVGAALERALGLAATYNRTNAIKLGLLSGTLTLADAQHPLIELRNVLEHKVRTDERAADDAWLWADLADCRLLLGDVEQAEHAYRVFAQKAETRSPSTTLSVLRELATALNERGDQRASKLVQALSEVEVALGAE